MTGDKLKGSIAQLAFVTSLMARTGERESNGQS